MQAEAKMRDEYKKAQKEKKEAIDEKKMIRKVAPKKIFVDE